MGETALQPAWTESLSSNFTVQDTAGSLVAIAAFALVLYAPGYLLALALNLFNFRRKSGAEQICWAVSLSFGAMPIIAYLAGRTIGLGAICWLSVCAGLTVTLLSCMGRSRSTWPRSNRWLVAGLTFGWIAFVIVSLVEIQVGKRLYFSVAMFDQSYRVAFTEAVARTGLPPANPLYFPGRAAPMRYYYFWYVLCASVMRIAGVTARQAFIASSVWAGFGLVAILGLYLRHFLAVVQGIRRQTILTAGLLLVTGADLFPAIGSLFAQRALNGEMEWWSEDQISSWIDSLLWVPHHVASLLCCLLCFLLLWRTREPSSPFQQCVALVLAGVSFASAFGLSIYVAFGMALLMLAWGLWLLFRTPRGLRKCVSLAASACVATLILLPFLLELMTGHAGNSAPPAHVFQLGVRRIIDPNLITGLPIFASLRGVHPAMLDVAMRLALILPGMALELGFYAAILFIDRRGRKSEPIVTAMYLSICGLTMITFIRSAVIGNNDFGYRAALLPQFFLLLLGVHVIGNGWLAKSGTNIPLTRVKRWLLSALLVLGVAGTAYQTIMLRLFLPLEASRPETGFANLPSDIFQARQAFAAMRRTAPADAVVQFDAVSRGADARGDVVSPGLFYERALLMDSGRQVLNAEPECAVEFGGDVSPCAEIRSATQRLYDAEAPSADQANGYCDHFGVTYLAASHLDPAWGDRGGWVWTLQPAAAEPGFRILRCGRGIMSPH